MKLFSTFMAILVIWLSCLPCADFALAKKAVEFEKSSSVSERHNESQDEHSDSCSPFCQCMCCAGFSITHSTAVLNEPVVRQNTHSASYVLTNIHEISLPIWQPPQLV
jgi:hypothetical protein